MTAPKPSKCTWLLREQNFMPCGAEAVATIHKGAFCDAHVKQAERIYGPSKKIFREELNLFPVPSEPQAAAK